MARRLIGTGKTGTDGSVTIPYTGIGAGIMDLQVETEIGGETVSQNFSITDCLIYDSGINDGQKNTNVTIGTNVTEQVSNEGTTLECTNGTSLVAAQYTYNSIISGDFETIITVASASRILMGFYGGNDSSRILLNNVTNRKYKFKRAGSVLTVQYYNGSDWVDLSWYNDSLGSKNCRFYMYLYADDTTNTVTFKDMEVLNKNENVLILDGSSNVIQSGDVVTMEGRLYKNGVLAKNTVLDVYKNGAMVGTVNTGSTGVASYNYTGLGVGETEFYFKYGSFVSETYEILDCIWYDPLTETPLKNNWYSTNLNLNTDSDGTLITNNSSNNLYFKPYPSNADLMLDTPYVIEFTVKSISGSIQPQIIGSGVSNGWIQDEGNGTHRLEIQADSQVHKFKSENSDTYVTKSDFNQVTLTGQSFARLLIASNSSVKLNDFKIYPI
ncbi:hypothetical protein [uncultured Methanobrevibacter sp.]|uniref:hypothetical protein n=1 Tax=uncultured Methanobrevibacter sp. TaxID=253161 RepID=UPI0025FB6D79|nr:hypothetical protein [uncultured Methanobrevibacter sp.]